MRLLLFLSLLTFISSPLLGQNEPSDDIQTVKGILQSQESAWNRGDLEGFMQGYLASEKLVFIGSRGLTYGWKQTLANYQKSYPDRETMGHLTFTVQEIKALGSNHMLVIGKWHLKRETKDDAQGHFSLTWEKINGTWLIIADHSS